MEKPEKVRKARIEGNVQALSAMGRVGGQRSAISRDLKKAGRENVLREIALEKARTEIVTDEGDVLPPDPKLIAELEENQLHG